MTDTLGMDQLLRVETWMHRVCRAAGDYELKGTLITAVDRAHPGRDERGHNDWATASAHAATLLPLLHPIARDDQRCYRAQHLLCAALGELARDEGGDPDAQEGVARIIVSRECDGEDGHDPLPDRRLLLFGLVLDAHGHGRYDQVWPHLRDTPTHIRALVLALTARMVHQGARGLLQYV